MSLNHSRARLLILYLIFLPTSLLSFSSWETASTIKLCRSSSSSY
jgi:hypothetical protein